MKKLFILIFLLFFNLVVFSQSDSINIIETQTLKIDSLTKNNNLLRDSIAKIYSKEDVIDKLRRESDGQKNRICSLRDSINNINDELEKKLVDITELKKREGELSKKITRKGIHEIEEKSSEKDKKIEKLNNKIKELDSTITSDRKIKFVEGQKSVFDEIAKNYAKSFEDLVKSTSKVCLERDLILLEKSDKKDVLKTMKKLKIYYEAQQVLAEKFNKGKISDAISKLNSIDKTSSVIELLKLLEEYEIRNEALKGTIQDINKIDEEFKGDNEKSRDLKFTFILKKIADYSYNYKFEYFEYPHISEIFLEILKIKQRDVDADIKFLIDKL